MQELTARGKWARERLSLRKDDVVLMRDKNVPRSDWRMARVIDAIESGDGLVRRVKLALINSNGKLRNTERAIHDIVLLLRPAISAPECHAPRA